MIAIRVNIEQTRSLNFIISLNNCSLSYRKSNFIFLSKIELKYIKLYFISDINYKLTLNKFF